MKMPFYEYLGEPSDSAERFFKAFCKAYGNYIDENEFYDEVMSGYGILIGGSTADHIYTHLSCKLEEKVGDDDFQSDLCLIRELAQKFVDEYHLERKARDETCC